MNKEILFILKSLWINCDVNEIQTFLDIAFTQSCLEANLRNSAIWEKPEKLQNPEVKLTVGGSDKVEIHLHA